MLSDLRAPRELVFLMRIVAILGATKIAAVVYYDLLNAREPSAADIAASEREIRGLAEEGEARVLSDFRRRSGGVLEAAERCEAPGAAIAACRWAEIWIERYGNRAADVLRSPADYRPDTVEAAVRYRRAREMLVERADPD